MKIKRWLFSIATVYLFSTSGLAAADEILLRWNANVESDLQGYKVYHGTQSKSYSPPISVGKITEYTVKNLEPDTTYYFAITAVDNAGNESAYSSESSVATLAADNQAPINSVISSTDDGNVAANTIDNNLATRWSAHGSGQWIQYDLGTIHSISAVAIAFYRGDTRISDFEILVSDDAQSWNSALRSQSSGATLQQEIYRITDATGRFVRIVGYGNSNNAWNSITEVDIVGANYMPPADTNNPTIAITAPTTNATFNTVSNTLSLGGTAADDHALQTVTWSASDGQSGTASGTTNWSAGTIQLQEGNTTFTVTATDAAGNKATDTLTVMYTPSAVFTWTGAINSNWEESGNWDVGEVPGDGADVTFPADCPLAIHSTVSGTSNIDQLSCSGQLTISGGSLTIDGDAGIN